MKLRILLAATGHFTSIHAFAGDQQSQMLVSTNPEALLSHQSQWSAQEADAENLKEFLTCFVDNMDLPPEVYAQCGESLTNAALTCQQSGWSMPCVDALVTVSTTCSEPIGKAIQSAQFCLNEGSDDGSR